MNKPLANTAPALLCEMATRFTERVFLIDCGQSISFGEFLAIVDRVSMRLASAGVGRGTRVGILMGNRLEWLVLYFAAMRLSAQVVGLNTWLTTPEIAYQLRHGQVELLVAEHEFLNRDWRTAIEGLRAAESGLPCLSQVLWIDWAPEGEVSHLDALLATLPVVSTVHPTAPAPSDIACILYTSGSTALAKGVPLLHQGLIDNMWCIGQRLHLTETDRLWLGVSLFWSFACVNALFTVLTHGGSIVLQHHFDAAEAVRLMGEHRCTVFYGTPNMVQALGEVPERWSTDLSALRTGATIGTPEQVRRCIEFGIGEICNVYGLTEAYGNSVVTDAKASQHHRLRCQGKVLQSQVLRIVDPQSRKVLPPGHTGEIELGGCVVPGYLDDPERTAESFSEDGFLKTGDLARLDVDGNVQYRGRLKEMIKTGGINVAPAEVEEVLATHPAVAQVFVTGIPDSRADELVGAVIIPEAGERLDEAQLVAHCRESLAAYKVPRHFHFCGAEALPQTATGKLQRNRLVELFG